MFNNESRAIELEDLFSSGFFIYMFMETKDFDRILDTEEDECWYKLSSKLAFTDERIRLSFNPPLILETPEDVGMSDLEKHQLEQIWQNPKEGIIVFKVQGIDKELDLDDYPELIPQIYEKIVELIP